MTVELEQSLIGTEYIQWIKIQEGAAIRSKSAQASPYRQPSFERTSFTYI